MNVKQLLRKIILDNRRLLSEEEFQKRNASLCQQVKTFVQENDSRVIHTFLPIARNNEPDVTSLFPTFWQEGRKIMASKTDFKAKVMTHHWLNSEAKLVYNHLGIPEPEAVQIADFSEVDLVLVPLLLGDKFGNRIGYGGGYYDRLLRDYSAISLGLSLAPLVDEIRKEDWDVAVTSILYFSSYS